MKKFDIESNLKRALEKSTPDCYEDIINGDYKNASVSRIDDIKQKKIRNITFNVKHAMAMCACLLLIVAGFGSYYIPVNEVYLDVNPSIEIKTNMYDKVIVVNAINDDGTSIMSSIDIKNKKLETAVDEIMNEMIIQGYINPTVKDNAILISVNAHSTEQGNKISESINVTVNKTLTDNKIAAVVMNQGINSMKDLQALSKETGVSVGKLQLIQKMIEQEDNEIDVNSLYSLKVKELLAYAEKNNINIEKLVNKIEEGIDDIDEDDEDDDEDDDDNSVSKENPKDNKVNNNNDKNNNNNKINKENKNNANINSNSNNKTKDDDENDDEDEDEEDDDELNNGKQNKDKSEIKKENDIKKKELEEKKLQLQEKKKNYEKVEKDIQKLEEDIKNIEKNIEDKDNSSDSEDNEDDDDESDESNEHKDSEDND